MIYSLCPKRANNRKQTLAFKTFTYSIHGQKEHVCPTGSDAKPSRDRVCGCVLKVKGQS